MVVSILLLVDNKLHLLSYSGLKYLPVRPTYFDGYPLPSSWYLQLPCWCRSPAQSGRGLLSLRMSNGPDRTYVEDVENSEKVLLPSRYLLFVALREDESDHRISFTLLDDLLLDLRHGSAIRTLVSGSLTVPIAGLAHPVRSPIPSRTTWVSPSKLLPFNLRCNT